MMMHHDRLRRIALYSVGLFRQERGGYCDRHGRRYVVQLLDDGVEGSSIEGP
nr:hypothetical protein [uncultured Desulfuromonas sp.]